MRLMCVDAAVTGAIVATARRQSLPAVTAQRRGTTDSLEGNYSSLSQHHAISTH